MTTLSPGSLRPAFIRDVMSENVQILHPGATLCTAARRMKEIDTGVMPVCEGDQLVGIVTDRDMVVRSLAHEADPRTEIVANVMSAPVAWCYEDQSIEEASKVMERKQIRRLAVLDRDKRLVGIVSLADLALTQAKGHVAEAILEAISEPTREERAGMDDAAA